MRLVIDGRRLSAHRTGVGRYLETLLKEWAVSGFPYSKTLVALSHPSGLDFVPRMKGVEAAILRPREPGILWENLGLGRTLRAGDLLFAPGNLVPGSWRGPTVLTLHDALQEVRPQDFPWHVRMRFGYRYRAAARRADRILTPSRSTANDVVRIYGVPPDRIRTIYPAAGPEFHRGDGTAARTAVPGLADHPFFLFIGKPSRRRHIPEILAAFRRHYADFPDHRLVLVGPGHAATPEPGVIQPGHVPELVLCGLLASAVALLYPSEYEGFGLPVVEAMASGCPVVTLRNSALVEVGGNAPLYLEDASANSLFEAMKRLTDDLSGRSDHIARGLAQAARFRTDMFADAVREELRAFLTGK